MRSDTQDNQEWSVTTPPRHNYCPPCHRDPYQEFWDMASSPEAEAVATSSQAVLLHLSSSFTSPDLERELGDLGLSLGSGADTCHHVICPVFTMHMEGTKKEREVATS